MKILVLGGGGFLGGKILKKLVSAENQLYSLVLRDPLLPVLECKYILMEDEWKNPQLDNVKFDVIVNVAMKRSTKDTFVSDAELNNSNCNFLLEVIRRRSTKETLVINTSTYIQNYSGKIGFTVEKYGASKELLSKSLRSDAASNSYKVIDLFLFTLYGPGDRMSHLVPLLLNSLHQDTELELSEGNQLMNLLYIDDAVANIQRALTMKVTGYNPFCLWDENYITVKDLVLLIERTFRIELRVKWGARQYAGHEMFVPWKRPFDQMPNMLTPTSLENGLLQTYKTMISVQPER
jgi:nucleoside-diphosphate-sugar epimerase